MITVPQKDWIRALTALPDQQLLQLSEALTENAEVSMLQLPQAGLGLMTFQESAINEQFYLGEFPLSVCSVAIGLPNGQRGSGSAQVMADNAELAKTLAILDAILANEMNGWQQVSELVQMGIEKRQQQDLIRNNILAKTRVDFSMLDNVESENEH